jgi:hypothetical protein
MLKNLGQIDGTTTTTSEVYLPRGVGTFAISGTFSTAAVSVQYLNSQGSWVPMGVANALTDPFEAVVDTNGVPIRARVAIVSGSPSGQLQVDYGIPSTDNMVTL